MSLARQPILRLGSGLLDVAHACEAASGPDRQLDARIAIAVFPVLRDLPRLDIGVWQHFDGSRVRALRYSFTRTAAAMLVPARHWIEPDPIDPNRIWIHGEEPGDAASARHPLTPLAISAAALRFLHKQRSTGRS